MRAALYYGPRDLRVQEREEPDYGPDEVLIRVAYTGICGSELHFYVKEEADILPVGERGPVPRPMGHEFAGVVAAVGAQVTTCQPGDRVSCVPWSQCGVCAYCRRGLVNHCPHKRRRTAAMGAFAEYVVMPQGAVHQIPADVPLQRAALAEPLSCCVWAVDQAGLRSGETVLIVGAGPMGLLLQLLAQFGGASQTIVSEISPARRKLAEQLGASLVIDPQATDLTLAVREATDGLGVDVAFEAVGHPTTVRHALDAVRDAGTVVIVGVAEPDATLALSPYEIYSRELTIRGCYTRRLSFERTLQWLRKPDFDAIISHELPLEAITEGFELAVNAQSSKVLIRPNDNWPDQLWNEN